MEVFIMSNNKEIICKLIKAKNQEANSYTDQTCYNAAYCYGYVDGATMALNTLSGVPERHKCYAILPIIPMKISARLTPLQFAAGYI